MSNRKKLTGSASANGTVPLTRGGREIQALLFQ
jgi:hypothetical protein